MNFDSSTGKKVSLSKLFNQPVYISIQRKVPLFIQVEQENKSSKN